MFYIHPKTILNLKECGIEIPLLDSRFIDLKEYIEKSVINEKLVVCHDDKINIDSLEIVHTKHYIEQLKNEPEKCIKAAYELVDKDGKYHRYNPGVATIPLKSILDKALYACVTTYITLTQALEDGFAYHIGGGMHHAMSFAGRGFCLLNDVAWAAQKLINQNKVSHIWIIDVDAHKGDGTAEIFRKNTQVTTMSIHMQSGWPLDSDDKNSPSLIPSDIDIPIAKPGTGYLNELERGLCHLVDKYPNPDLAIVLQGADPYEHDTLPSSSHLKLPLEELEERDQIIYHFLEGREIPQAYVMAGGYGPKSIEVYKSFIDFIISEAN